ncbi:prion-inhibition and propagation-domain-containing protein [Lasiosphaeria miniovina]|uniref:Prion-inhibition and propagation-domain-containing protein n=1 Tax=Lasiosphaeria miniovina TaxID=1954250 RepID=A0AA40AMM2_9PEZI|nr:prion-inhibition and propagation-domain-containing protein [Lasiosphaeria miniovina]KAK0718619.1 prion-inhibition and propagation-domain-containing protein [Lasiosphaeria miniovina]
MELAGLAIGAVALIGAFKDALDLFDLFTAVRDFGREYSILLTKLDIEKFLLLQWAEQVKLLDFDQKLGFLDSRLNERHLQTSVAQILSCICLLLRDASQLKERYGVADASAADVDSFFTIDDSPAMSGPCMKRFEQRFRQLQVSARGLKHQPPSAWAKARWAVQDKRKFGDLVSELAHFVTRLREVVLPIATDSSRTAELANTKDLKRIYELDKLKMVLEAAAGYRGAVAGPAQELIDRICCERVLRPLWFRKMDDRRESIKSAHKRTFQWALEGPDKAQEGFNSLREWLRRGSGIYWLSGKAGSGKSTLMKFVHSGPQTAQLLNEWAKMIGAADCTIADFFFYYLAMTPEQNTQEGLSKALLFKILTRYPAIVPKALPNLWREANEGREDLTAPSQAEIKYAFEVISSDSNLPAFCLFIDGFDEYVGDYRNGVTLINRLALSPRIKVIVSSRPEPHCVAAFDGQAQMKLQELTEGDIATYVQDIIGRNTHMEARLKKQPGESAEIMREIVLKASGVFLWVVLACRSLQDGFHDYDTIEELQQRIRELPAELKDMFIHMLARVDKRHRVQASMLLRLCFLHRKACGEARVTHELDRLYALECAFIADYFSSGPGTPVSFLPKSERSEACKILDGRLRSRCGGLLELTRRASAETRSPFCFCEAADWGSDHSRHDEWADATVTFMHRSVFDFLDDQDTWELDYLKTAAMEFDLATVMSLGRLYLAMQSQSLQCPEEVKQALTCLLAGIAWGAEGDRLQPSRRENIFWKMGPCLDMLYAANGPVFGLWDGQFEGLAEIHSHEPSNAFSHATLLLAIEAGAVNYVKHYPYLRDMTAASTPPCGCPPLLCQAIQPMSIIGGQFKEDSSKRPPEAMRASNGMLPGSTKPRIGYE